MVSGYMTPRQQAECAQLDKVRSKLGGVEDAIVQVACVLRSAVQTQSLRVLWAGWGSGVCQRHSAILPKEAPTADETSLVEWAKGVFCTQSDRCELPGVTPGIVTHVSSHRSLFLLILDVVTSVDSQGSLRKM